VRNYAEGVEEFSPGLASDSAPTLGKRRKDLPRSGCTKSVPPFIQPHFGGRCMPRPPRVAARSSRQPLVGFYNAFGVSGSSAVRVPGSSRYEWLPQHRACCRPLSAVNVRLFLKDRMRPTSWESSGSFRVGSNAPHLRSLPRRFGSPRHRVWRFARCVGFYPARTLKVRFKRIENPRSFSGRLRHDVWRFARSFESP
jgi:hypothetical protein